MTKRALITGITGQDGAYLAKLLVGKGYKVFGTFRRTSTPNFWRLQYVDVLKNVELISMDLSDLSSVIEAVRYANPDEIYHLAAQSFVGRSFEEPLSTSDVTGLGTARVLEAIRILNIDVKVYQASTSELFGNESSKIQSESSLFAPESPYAAAKLYSYWMSQIYRKGYKIFISNGILFNHESPIRGMEFVTRKVTNAVAKIKLGLQSELKLGNLYAIRDWGFAKDYVEAMWLILQQDIPNNYVIATGEGHSVRELVDLTFDIAGLSAYDFLSVDKKLNRVNDVNELVGDNTKAKDDLGWSPRTTFKDLIEIMYKEDLRRWSDYISGKEVVWDAPSYKEDVNLASVRYSIKT